MSQEYDDDGNVIPVTVVSAGPCFVTQVTKNEKLGRQSVQIGYIETRKLPKPQSGHLKDLPKLKYLREFQTNVEAEYKRGDKITVELFKPEETVKISGRSKGKGFQGVVKRHGFKGGPASHGHKDNLRAPGSIGSTEPARVFKGTRMAGRLGGKNVTTRSLRVVSIDPKKNIMCINGSVPGARNGLLEIVTQE